MTAIVRNELRRLMPSTAALVGLFAVFSALYFSIYPDFAGDAVDDDLLDAFPEGMMEFFGIEALDTIEGFVAAELYSFFWVLLVGIYFAYTAAGTVTLDVESRKMDLTLASPVTRESVLAQKTAAMVTSVVVLNVAVAVMVYGGSRLIDEPIQPVAVVMVHLLSVPYFLVCIGLGLVLSVTLERSRTAQVTALATVFVLWLFEGVSNLDPDIEWLGYLTPSHYYSEVDVLVHEEYAFVDASILMLAFLLLYVTATQVFTERDV
ncbi:MAG: ABC transporter permease subunit [Halobacteriales archaeon]